MPGLICLDHEDDPSLKEETEPRYHAREVAWMRSRLNSSVLLLASAHPSLETLQRMGALETGNQGAQGPRSEKLLVISQPVMPPAIHLVDLRRLPHGTILSEPMIEGIAAALKSGERAILYLNRKGFAPALLCRACGQALRCQRCSVALTFYKQAGHLSCHYCNAVFPLPDTCPSCFAARIEPIGVGTEGVEEIVLRLFPNARVARLDREKARTPNRAEAIRRLFAAGELDLLIGTQMLFQGPPLPPVRFVGLIHADAGLHLPDFQAGERTYHALLDAIALARPREAGGSVLLQTYLPAHPVIAAIVEQDPEIFYHQELLFRRVLAYPPFTHLMSLCVSGKQPERVKEAAEQWAAQLRTTSKRPIVNEERQWKPLDQRRDSAEDSEESGADIIVLGPVPASVARIRGRYRWQILVKSASLEAARRTVRRTLDDLEGKHGRSGLKYHVDVDPVAMI
ncbi:MAG: primosomal protein N' [Nitrospiraceae bacterium]